MKMKVFRHALVATMLFGVVFPASAQNFEDIGALETRLIAALGAEIGTAGGPAAPIDRRLKLAACSSEIAFDAPAMGAVAVRCPALGWRIRVPIVRGESQTIARAQPVIRRGDPVQLRAGGDFFEITAQAIAEQDGVEGAKIRVRTDPKAAPVLAEVVSAGIVRIPGLKGSH